METIKKLLTRVDVLVAVWAIVILAAIGIRFDLNKSEWAYWLQAAGGIVAIIGAYRIANSQHQRQVEADKRNKVADEVRKLEIAHVFLNEITLLARVIKEEVDGQHAGAGSRASVDYLS